MTGRVERQDDCRDGRVVGRVCLDDNAIRRHVADRPQFNDITLVCLARNG